MVRTWASSNGMLSSGLGQKFGKKSARNKKWAIAHWFFAFLILVRPALIPIAFWAAQPFFQTDKAYLGDLSESLVAACVLIGTWIMAIVERRSVSSYGLKDRQAFRHLATGALSAF